MRSVSFVLLVFAGCVVSPLAISQQRDSQQHDPAAVASAESGPDTDGTARGKSGFGQVMSVLTGMLQDAAARESRGGSSAASRFLSSDESALTISVTPVAGSATFFVDKRPVDSTRNRSVAATTIDAGAAERGVEMAMQAEGNIPD